MNLVEWIESVGDGRYRLTIEDKTMSVSWNVKVEDGEMVAFEEDGVLMTFLEKF